MRWCSLRYGMWGDHFFQLFLFQVVFLHEAVLLHTCYQFPSWVLQVILGIGTQGLPAVISETEAAPDVHIPSWKLTGLNEWANSTEFCNLVKCLTKQAIWELRHSGSHALRQWTYMPKTYDVFSRCCREGWVKNPDKGATSFVQHISDPLIVKKLIPRPDSALLQLVVNILKAAWHRGVVKAKGWWYNDEWMLNQHATLFVGKCPIACKFHSCSIQGYQAEV
jgi:hypothetical protein